MSIATHILEDLLLVWCIVGVGLGWLAIRACQGAGAASREEESRWAEYERALDDVKIISLSVRGAEKKAGTRQ